ncbi:MAG: type II secretion system protein [Puniceicoccales bacterium]
MKNSTHTSRRLKGFTLIELLTVIAIIGILAGILIPVVGGAKKAALRAQTKAQFGGWAQALEQYKKEYGYYPDVSGLNGGSKVNVGSNAQDFIRALSAREPDGDALSDRTLNRKAIAFYSFGQNEQINKLGDYDENGLYDAFGNPDIYVVVDHDGNGVIERSKLPSGTSDDLKARVAIWTEAGNDPDFEDIKSWD